MTTELPDTHDSPPDTGPLALKLNEGLGVIPRATWEERYAAQVRKRAGWTPEECAEAARVAAEQYDCGLSLRGLSTNPGPVVFLDAPHDNPEDEADEEMSYWTNDGEG